MTAEASDDQRAKGMATGYTQSLRESLALRGATGIQVLGPSPAFLHRLRGQYRWSVTIKGVELTQALHLLPQGRGFSIDIDPI